MYGPDMAWSCFQPSQNAVMIDILHHLICTIPADAEFISSAVGLKGLRTLLLQRHSDKRVVTMASLDMKPF